MVLYWFGPFFSQEIPLIDLMLFSTLISAVDPVAVLSVFTEINVNEVILNKCQLSVTVFLNN